MALFSFIKDGTGTGNLARVGKEKHQVYTCNVAPDLPPIGTKNTYRYYSAYFENSSGSSDLNIDATGSTPTFQIEAADDYDLYITKIGLWVVDSAVIHSRFGNLVLSIGVSLYSIEDGERTDILTNAYNFGQAIQQTAMEKPFGDGATSFELSDVIGNEDAWFLPITLSDYVPCGIRLGYSTRDKIVATIQEDLTGLTEFTIRAFGYRHYEVNQ